MPDLLWPGDERAGDLFTDAAVLAAMVQVEEAWLGVLVGRGLAPASASLPDGLDGLAGLVGEADLVEIAVEAESGGNPVIPLVSRLRSRLEGDAATWLHRGLTSQDVVDTALVLCLGRVLDEVAAGLHRQAASVAGLARTHRDTVMAGRTLTQHAVPITFGLKAAGWLDGLAAAARRLASRGPLPVQCGGAAGTLAATAELARVRGLDDPAGVALAASADLAAALGLGAGSPWHGERSVLTEAGDALVTCADVWGRIAADVAVLSRPEIGELREGAGGGSSTMPHKQNPVLSTLLRRHALTAPQLGATLHLAAGSFVDERPDGAWHAEWDALRTLARRSVVATSQAADLLAGLVADVSRMASNVAAARDDLHAEQGSITKLAGGTPAGEYLGAAGELVDQSLARAASVWKDLS